MSTIQSHIEPAPARGTGAGGGVLGVVLGPWLVAWRHRSLIWRMARRDVTARYRDSALGWAWAVLTPLMLMAVYTFVFAVVLKARWHGQAGTGVFASRVFLGLIVFQVLGSMMGQTPALLRQQRSLVKKVVFPLEALVLIRLAVAMFDFAMGYLVFLGFGLAIGVSMGWGVLLAPVAVIPVALLGVGMGWLLSGLGAYLTDLGPIAGTLATMIMFLSALFYPIENVPESWRWAIAANPVAGAIDTARGLSFDALRFDAGRYGLLLVLGWCAACAGLAVFRRVRGGFADVL